MAPHAAGPSDRDGSGKPLGATPTTPGGPGRAGGALANVVVKALSVPVEKACRLFLVVVAAPILGQAGFGRFQFADTVAALSILATELGLGIWTTRALARTPERAPDIVATGLGVKALATVPYLVLVAVFALLLPAGEARIVLLLLAVAAAASAFVEYCDAVFRGYERLGDEARLNVTRALLVTSCGLAGLWARRSLFGLGAGIVVGSLAAAAWGLWMLRRRYRLALALGRRSFDRRLARAAVAEALPLWLATLLSLVYFKGDIALLRAFADDGVVGTYAAAYKIFEGTMILPSVILAAWFPVLVRTAAVDGGAHRRAEVRLGAALLGLGLVVGAAALGGATLLVDVVFGAGFGQAVPSLRILSLAVPLVFLNYGLTHFLIARHLERRNLAFNMAMVVLNLTMNLILIPRLGGAGAAWATGGTELGLTVCCLLALAASTSAPPRLPAAPAAENTARWSA